MRLGLHWLLPLSIVAACCGWFLACNNGDEETMLWLNEQAMLCEERGDFLCAETKYTEILTMRPDDILLLQRRGRLRALRGQTDLAAADVAVIETNVGTSAWVAINRLEYRAADPSLLRNYDDAVTDSRGHPAAHFYRGVRRAALRDLTGAKTDFEAAYSKWPEYTPALLYQALVAREAGQSELALKLFTDAIAADNDREARQGSSLFILRFGGSFQPYLERGRLLTGSGNLAVGCRDILAAVQRGYIGDPFGCVIQLEQLASSQTRL
jgi:tetratricopeptide (TPR) repeat protein